MARVKLKEGDVFILPIGESYGIGIISRLSKTKIPFGYFYNILLQTQPKIESLDLSKENTIYCSQFGIQGFKDGTWKILGNLKDFERKNWPMPIFYQKRELLPGELVYIDDDLEEYKRERAPLNEEEYKNYPSIGLGGSGYIEKKLAKLLLVK